MPSSPYPVVCMCTGDGFGDLYVTRLHSMLTRHMPVPFRLFCFSDRAREVPKDVELLPCNDWELPQDQGVPTRQKLRLFDSAKAPWEEFLFFDLSLVIRRSLAPMVAFAAASDAPLITVKDWHYDCYNTSVMRIRPGTTTQAVYDAYVAGNEYPFYTPTDQDFVHAAIADLGLQNQVAAWPDGLVMSYKFARKTLGLTSTRACQLVERSTILKFHGFPKMHEIPSWRRFPTVFLKNPHRIRRSYFAVNDVNRHWR